MDRLIPGLAALLAGAIAAVALLVPFLAISYRRRGGLTLGRTLAWLALLLYILGLWAYTLTPIPTGAYTCVGIEWDPWQGFRDIVDPRFLAQGIRNPALEQIALNVVLFLPWGVLLRMLAGRGVVVATLTGFGISLLIEVTQLTGVWGVFPCAYRLFDTGDLLTNTTGALLGSLLAAPILNRARPTGHRLPVATRVSVARRLTGMLCDALLAHGAILALSALGGLGVRALGLGIDNRVSDATAAIVTVLALGAFLLATGSTPGERVVLLRGVDGRRPVAAWRAIRFLVGIGGYTALAYAPLVALLAFVVASIVAVALTPDRRGLAHLLSGMRVEIDPPVPARDAS